MNFFPYYVQKRVVDYSFIQSATFVLNSYRTIGPIHFQQLHN